MSTQGPFTYKFLNQHLKLLPQKAIFWEEKKILIVADVHFGKVGHFRKAGIAIPKLLEQEDLAALSDLLREFKPERLIFLGDLFHSEMNNDWDWMVLWRELFPKVEMTLVRGNHDILHDTFYLSLDFEVVDQLLIEPFLFSHEMLREMNTNFYNISGHIHPAIKLRGQGRQTLSLSCYFFSKQHAVLPAFGRFTGSYFIKFGEEDKVFGILNSKVIEL